MKTIMGSLLLFIMSSSVAISQTAFEEGHSVLQFGVGYGLLNSYGNVTVPPVTLALDYGSTSNLSVGGYVGYSASRDVMFPSGSYGGLITEDAGINYTYFILGGRLCYHFDTGDKNLDGYIGAMLGYNAVSASSFGLSSLGGIDVTAKGSALIYGGQLGGRYFVSPNVALFAEVGYGIGYITGGLSIKL